MDYLFTLFPFVAGFLVLLLFYLITLGLIGKEIDSLGAGRRYLVNWVAIGFLTAAPAFIFLIFLWQIGIF
jgi:hypothetical protein